MKLKLKTRKAAAKRVKVKKNCICRKKAYKGHLLRRKSKTQLRRLANIETLHKADQNAFAHMLVYI